MNTYFYLALISKMININRYNSYKQKVFEIQFNESKEGKRILTSKIWNPLHSSNLWACKYLSKRHFIMEWRGERDLLLLPNIFQPPWC